MGNWLRDHAIPFWSWMEINARRWPRMGINAVELGKVKGDPAATAVFTGVALARLFTLYGLFWLYNNLVHPDEEDDLPTFARQNAHLIFGRNADGSVKYLNNVGALGDFLEWAGIQRVKGKVLQEGDRPRDH